MKLIPKKSLGQNFLHDPQILAKIITSANLDEHDTVLEVGPGTGTLTKLIYPKVKEVIAVEKDSRAIEELKNMFQNSSVKIVEDDIMRFNPLDHGLLVNNYKIVANIPYYITSNFLKIILEDWPQPKLIVLTIQEEVAQRIMAKPPKMNILALAVQFYSNPRITGHISAGSFFPKPNVDSAIITLQPKTPPLDLDNAKKYFSLIKSAFAEKRKQLAKVLGQKLNIPKERIGEMLICIGIRQDARPEILSQDQWLALLKSLR